MSNSSNDIGNEADLVAAIRQRPGMYIGSATVRGLNELLRYVIVYAFRTLKADAFAIQLGNTFGGKITVDGIGSAMDDNIASRPALEGSGSMLAPFELASLNAISRHFQLSLYSQDGKLIKRLEFEKGQLKKGKIDDRSFLPSKLEIAFDLDDTLLDLSEPLNPFFHLQQLETLAFLNKGKTLSLGYVLDGRKYETAFRFENGLRALLDLRKLARLSTTQFDTWFEEDFGDFSAEVAFSFWQTSVNEPFAVSFVNYERSPFDGVHLTAMILGIEAAFSRFIEKHQLSDEFVISSTGIRRLLLGAVKVTMERPHFEGAFRGKLLSPEIKEPLATSVADRLVRALENDPEAAVCTIKWIARESQIAKFQRNP